jgi:hypothetical protein
VKRNLFYILAILCFLSIGQEGRSQVYKIKGNVYDSSRTYPLEAVSVQTTGGKFTITDTEGFYEIEVTEKDSIWFSYLNKPTIKFPVLKITDLMSFDIALHVNIPVLREVKIRPRNYRQDSLQNRRDYAKIFNYEKPKLKPTLTGTGVGFDLDEIINMFRFKRNRSLAGFQKRLLIQEEDKYIDFRFNKALVRRLTQLDGNALDSFMRLFRPAYSFTKNSGDYEFQQYIKSSFARFKRGLQPLSMQKPEEN